MSWQACQPGLSTRPPPTRIRWPDRAARRWHRAPGAATPRCGRCRHRPASPPGGLGGARTGSRRPRRRGAEQSLLLAARPRPRRHSERPPRLLAQLGGGLAGPPPEDQDVAQGVAPEPVGPVQPGRRPPGGEESGDAARPGLGIHPDAAHGVVDGGPHLHRLPGDVDARQGLELLAHGGELLADLGGAALAGDVQVGAAVGGAAARLHLLVDGAGDHVAAGEVHLDRVVALHEALARGVAEDPALAAHRLGDQDAARSGRPDHPGGMELDELHVLQLGAGLVGHGGAVTGALPGVRGVAVHPPPAAARQHHRPGPDDHELAGVAVVAEGAADPAAGR